MAENDKIVARLIEGEYILTRDVVSGQIQSGIISTGTLTCREILSGRVEGFSEGGFLSLGEEDSDG